MTDQERQLIETLASRIHNAPAPQIDREADDLIRRGIGARPDALYILTQTVLIQEMALNQAKAQIDELNQRAAAPVQPPASFLGRQGGYQGSGYQSGNYPTPPPQYYEPPPPPSGGRFSGFLHQAATTAAGVVAGELAFSALGSLFGGHSGYMGGGGGFFGGGSGISPVSETIINNNYYDDDRDRGRDDTSYVADRDDRMADDPQAADNIDTSDDYVDDGSSSDDGSGSVDV